MRSEALQGKPLTDLSQLPSFIKHNRATEPSRAEGPLPFPVRADQTSLPEPTRTRTRARTRARTGPAATPQDQQEQDQQTEGQSFTSSQTERLRAPDLHGWGRALLKGGLFSGRNPQGEGEPGPVPRGGEAEGGGQS
ncbi:unnamed protein product [Arctogadus glacialis]